MKTLFTTLFVIFLSANVAIAQKCKPHYKDKDKFSGITTEYWGGTITAWSWYTGNIKYIPSLFVANIEGKDKVVIIISVDGKLDSSQILNNQKWFEIGTKFFIKLENEILEFEVEDSKVVNHTSNTYAYVYSSITKTDLEKLNTQTLEMAKVLPFKDSEDIKFQFNIPNGRDKMFKKQLNCFLQL